MEVLQKIRGPDSQQAGVLVMRRRLQIITGLEGAWLRAGMAGRNGAVVFRMQKTSFPIHSSSSLTPSPAPLSKTLYEKKRHLVQPELLVLMCWFGVGVRWARDGIGSELCERDSERSLTPPAPSSITCQCELHSGLTLGTGRSGGGVRNCLNQLWGLLWEKKRSLGRWLKWLYQERTQSLFSSLAQRVWILCFYKTRYSCACKNMYRQFV